MANKISVTASDGHVFDAWRADPAGTARGGVVILQAIYGLTTHLGDVCDMLAEADYSAMAPALYDRSGKNVTFSYGHDGMEAGRAFRENLKQETVLADVAACAAALRPALRVAVMGFCTGGTWAWVSAAELDLDAGVIFYGSDVYDRREFTPNCPTILHYGDQDVVVPIDQVETIRAEYPQCPLHIYPGAGHAFFNPEQDSHDAAAAALAWERTIAFLETHLAA